MLIQFLHSFRDVMACMALIPVQWLGQEASGTVVRTGSKVVDWVPGDRVCTIHVGTHATRIRTDSRGLARIPDSMSFEDAAALPVVNMTAYYAFVSIAKLRRGQSVLIHAAAGGVGQAAIQYVSRTMIHTPDGVTDMTLLTLRCLGWPNI